MSQKTSEYQDLGKTLFLRLASSTKELLLSKLKSIPQRQRPGARALLYWQTDFGIPRTVHTVRNKVVSQGRGPLSPPSLCKAQRDHDVYSSGRG